MNLALFDFDGTLTTRDSFVDFARYAIPRARWHGGRLRLAPAAAAYKLGWISTTDIRQRVAYAAFRGLDANAIRRSGERFAADVIPGRLRADAMRRLEQHQAEGDVTVVVSASIDAYLAPWCAAAKMDLICSVLEDVDGVLTGRLAGADCCGDEKRRRVEARYDLRRFERIIAYGDTPEDAALLSLADVRFYRGERVQRAPDAS